MEKTEKTYVDYAINNGKMIMVSMHMTRKAKGVSIRTDHHDYKLRPITLSEKIKNFLIKKLGGDLQEQYTRKWLYRTEPFQPKQS